ncbi:ATP-grasp fold amidoligase family protein [Sphingomonas sp.]|uniref:ATP-grasp fold amidoligase family protein n=1 Tax=Sphingomonas sp. TaxID=28214 RepID=UPI00286B5AC9|nr:ATP-grasp fold amidoligase family protein [Sphingomonas sp.]
MNALALAPPFPIVLPAASWARLRVALLYRWRHGRWPDLDAPVRFTEWVQWRKLNDRSHSLALLTDKAHSKAIAEARLGSARTIPTLWLGEALPEVAPWKMPFIVKANHGCGQFVVVRTNADYDRAKAAAPRWLKRAYGGLLDEWHYGAARRLVLVEPYIGGPKLPMDYKVYVFGGRAALVQVHAGRGADHRWTQFDRDWMPLSDDPIDARKPDCLAEMLAAAETMAGDEPFLRVDFYCENGALSFGECCLYPGSGLDPFTPDSLDLKLGALWTQSA